MSRTPKAELNELAQAKNTPLEFKTELLDPNRPNEGFISVVQWNGIAYKGYGRSKKDAEHEAARIALTEVSEHTEADTEQTDEETFERWEIHPELLAECLKIAAKAETNLESIRANAVALYMDLLLDLGYEPEEVTE
ncbi:MAG: hypothetical protein RLZZ156_73 [Deinococcota bacterium]|jgi:hypothetical protein